ncbi:MAG: HU family DNA-binding protein [Deltaproteobacteria bacterium]|nr:HU family DNA-binding protein [Deltaproteobacteria bacterium]
MTKAEFTGKIAERAGISKSEAAKVLDAVTGELTELLNKEQKITFPGFGTFKTIKRAERKGRNPRTGNEIIIPARSVVQFKPGSALKEAVK